MDIKEEDIILLSDDNSYLVAKKVQFNSLNYYCVVNMDDNEDVKILYESNGVLIELEDPDTFDCVLAEMYHHTDISKLLDILKRRIQNNNIE